MTPCQSDVETLKTLIEDYKREGGQVYPKVVDRSLVVQAVGTDVMDYLIKRCGGLVIAWDLIVDATMETFEPGTEHPDFKAVRGFLFGANGMASDSVQGPGLHETWRRLTDWHQEKV